MELEDTGDKCMGILEILTIIFVICKLVEVISWSWIIVFSPLILSVVIYLIIFIGYCISFHRITRK